MTSVSFRSLYNVCIAVFISMGNGLLLMLKINLNKIFSLKQDFLSSAVIH